jgi:hypothetical protein
LGLVKLCFQLYDVIYGFSNIVLHKGIEKERERENRGDRINFFLPT